MVKFLGDIQYYVFVVWGVSVVFLNRVQVLFDQKDIWGQGLFMGNCSKLVGRFQDIFIMRLGRDCREDLYSFLDFGMLVMVFGN